MTNNTICSLCRKNKTITNENDSFCKKCTNAIMNAYCPKIPRKLKKELKLLIPDPINLNSWLNSKNSNLDNKTPLELINEKNLKPLWNMIEQINSNVAN